MCVEQHPKNIGLIPACAGKTGSARGWRRVETAHPRVCGENATLTLFTRLLPGSSPRVRGKRNTHVVHTSIAGLIPACAGKTQWISSPAKLTKAHPRVCGENSVKTAPIVLKIGSSPRVRGKPREGFAVLQSGGLIPACAGKTIARLPCAFKIQAHPRVCGENGEVDDAGGGVEGSSPRVRGKLLLHALKARDDGLIPACAGKTLNSHTRARRAGAHPRVCGENFCGLMKIISLTGSSPRVRGKPLCRGRLCSARRLIPACAGKTSSPT